MNSTLTALMPSETSSQIANATNGIEPPRGLVSVKASKDGILKQVVPEFERLKNQYELLWQMPNNDGYLKLVGVMQKFVDLGPLLVICEATGSYDRHILEAAAALGVACHRAHGSRMRAYARYRGRRRHRDPLDILHHRKAQRIRVDSREAPVV